MFCPKCGSEYRQGFTECVDCKVPLVAEPPVEPAKPPEPTVEKRDLVLVFESSAPSEVAVAGSLLTGAGIRYWVAQEGLQDLIGGVGRIGGINPIVGPVRIQVEKGDAEEAAALLSDLTSGGEWDR